MEESNQLRLINLMALDYNNLFEILCTIFLLYRAYKYKKFIVII